MDRIAITENELLAELAAALAQPDSPDAYTMAELCAIVPKSEDWIRKRVHALIRAGTVQPVRVPKANVFGVVAPTYAYRFQRAA